MADQRLDRRLDALQQRLGVDPEEQAQGQQRQHGGELDPVHVGEGGILAGGLTGEDPLEAPQHVHGGENHADGGQDGVGPVGHERADQRQELAHETRQAGQPDRGEGHRQEDPAQLGRRLPHAAEGVDLAGVAPVVEDPDEEEEGAGGQAVADHGEQPALDPHGGEGERAEDDEAEVGHRRIGDHLLQVALHRRHDGAVEDADGGQREQGRGHGVGQGQEQRGEVDRGLGEEREREAQEAVGAEFQEQPGQQHRPGCGRLDVGVGQPGVEREERHLDGEAGAEGQEQPPGGVGVETLPGHEGPQVERQVVAGGLGLEDGQRQDAEQQQRRAGGGVDEELESGVDPPVVAPRPDEEVHRDEHRLPEHEEQEEVDRQEDAHQGGLEGEVGVDPLVDMGRGQHGDGEQQPGQHDHEQADAVDAHQVVDPEGLDPHLRLDELVAGHTLVEGDEEGGGQPQRHQREADGDGPHRIRPPGGDGGGDGRPGGGDGEEGGAVGEGHQRDPRTRKTNRTTVAPDRSVRA